MGDIMKTDQRLQADVEQELRWDPSVRSEDIGVSVTGGVVQLDGHVDSYFGRWAAERAAMRVSDAKAVASEITIELPSSAIRTDADIARVAMEHLDWNDLVPGTVQVLVHDGSVTLSGTTEWQFQKEEAARSVRYLTGVRWLSNEIAVTPKASAVDVKGRIETALRRNAEIDAEGITVEAAGGDVTLRGHVRSWAERDEAEYAAWAAPGVSNVDDRILIS